MISHMANTAKPGDNVTICAIGDCTEAVDLNYDDHYKLRNDEVGCLAPSHSGEDVANHAR
jgi:predicted phosphoribosyltransferase